MKLLLTFMLLSGLAFSACTRNFPGKGTYVLKVVSADLPISSFPTAQVVDENGNSKVISNLPGKFNKDSTEFISEPIKVGQRFWCSVTAERNIDESSQEQMEHKHIVLNLQLLRNNKVVRQASRTGEAHMFGSVVTGKIEHQISIPYLPGDRSL